MTERMVRTEMVEERIDGYAAAPKAYHALAGLHRYLKQCSLERPLLNLVDLRASQINGCAYCIDMHWKDAVAAGEDPQRLYMLDAWREWGGYTARERAALEWTEAVTLVASGHVPDEAYRRAREQFGETELTELTLAVAAINSWNRMAISLRKTAGGYRPGEHE